MNPEHEAELEAALKGIRGIAVRARPDRRDVRALLIPLGRSILADGAEGLASWLERIRKEVARFGPAWARAVQDELDLACTEHVQSVDPRFLTLPDYDLEYTLEARERLEARLAAAHALGHSVPARLLDGIARADRTLRSHLDARRPAEDANGS